MRSSRVSVLARFGSAAAVAGLALTAVLAPATAAGAATEHYAHAHKIPTHLLIRAHAVPGTHHKSFLIVGKLVARRHPLSGETVYLASRIPHTHTKFAVIGSATTGTTGRVRFTVTPTTRTAYVLVFKGDVTYRHSRSRVIRRPRA
jgi:hypothetical protein